MPHNPKTRHWLIVLIITLLASGNLLGQTAAGEKQSTEDQQLSIKQAHRHFAVECNTEVWNLLSKEDRTSEESVTMINAAHASFYHWQFAGTPVNIQRGYWLLSHVYSVLKLVDGAVYYGDRCWEITEKEELKDFDLAYAYEALARARAAAGNRPEWEKYHQMAVEAGELIANQEDKNLFQSDLEAEPWYGMKEEPQKD